MKHTKLALGLALILSVFMFTGCPGALKADITVTFMDNNRIVLDTVTLHSGDVIDPYDIPSAPYKSYNDFSYWSESTASLDAAVKFDFTKPITKNVTLYALYTPQISSSSGIEVTANSITLKLNDSKAYPLDDGSYAGFSVTDYMEGGTTRSIKLNIPSKDEDTSSRRYLTYKIDPPLAEGSHLITIMDCNDCYTKSLTVAAAGAVKNLSVAVEDSMATVTFDTLPGWKYYTVNAYQGNDLVFSQTEETDYNSSSSTETALFYGLNNNVEYTFKVFTDGTDKCAQVTATPKITKKETDWLMVMYMDGDNNLHDQIFLDLNEAEKGLDQIQYYNGDPKTGYDKVNVVALWDGAVSWQGVDEQGNPATVTPQIGKSGTYLYQLGTDSWEEPDANGNLRLNGPSCTLGYETKNLSYTANWLVPQVTDTPNVNGEINMGHAQTLVNFLTWATDHYTVNKGIILQFSDHGGGPRSVRYVQTKDGRTIKVGDTSGRRALCWDESSNSNFLKTKDVSYALNILGFGKTKPKLAMILMDVCLGSSIEDAYQFKDYAEYLAASPNTIPGSGLDYKTLFKGFKKNTTVKAIGQHILKGYRDQYYASELWNSIANSIPADKITDEATIENWLSMYEWLSEYGITTFSITDLSKMQEVQEAIDDMCDVLLDCDEEKESFVMDLGQNCVNIVNVINDNSNKYNLYDMVYYQGTYNWLYDIGYIAEQFAYYSAEKIGEEDNINFWPELNTKALAVITKLDEAIKYSWRDSPFYVVDENNIDFYSRLEAYRGDTPNTTFEHYYGLSICGANIATDGEALTQGSAPNWYKTDLEFGKDSRWGDLLAFWFNN